MNTTALSIIPVEPPARRQAPCEWEPDTVLHSIWSYMARWPGKLKACPMGAESPVGDLAMDAANFVHWLSENLEAKNDKRGELRDLAAALAVEARRLLEIGWGSPLARDSIGQQLTKLGKRMDDIADMCARCLNDGDLHPVSEVPHLTFKQTRVLRGLARGASIAELAVQTHTSAAAVKAHVQTLRVKIGCVDTESLRLWAQQHGFADGPAA